MRNRFILVFVFFLVLLSYSNVIHGEFQFDDDLFITENPWVKSPGSLLKIDILRALTSGVRPVLVLTFAFNRAVNDLEVEGYHLVNIGFHLIMVILV